MPCKKAEGKAQSRKSKIFLKGPYSVFLLDTKSKLRYYNNGNVSIIIKLISNYEINKLIALITVCGFLAYIAFATATLCNSSFFLTA